MALSLSLDRTKAEELSRRIVEWYEAHGDRDLPWRRAKDGWSVLVATLMLRKTTVKQVVKVYGEFMRRYPTPQSLLSASEGEVEELIMPLGLQHQKAKHLLELAKVLVQKFDGRVPCNEKELKELPGVGDYAASEVLLRVYGQAKPLLDRNMTRVVERVFGVRSAKKRPHKDQAMWSFAESLVPKDPELAEKFNFGVLDFARKICTAEKPHCGTCPIKDLCSYFSRSGG